MITTSLLIECIGWIGAVCVLIAFFLISTKRIDASKPIYHWLNIVGALGLIIHTSYNSAFPSAFVNVIWVGVAVYSLLKLKPSKS
jgi:hypothetical protein